MKDFVITACTSTAFPFIMASFVAGLHRDEKIRRWGYLLMAVAMLLLVVSSVLDGMPVYAALAAAVAAWNLYEWWNSGGGGGLRRAWRKARSLMPRMSPAPQTS